MDRVIGQDEKRSQQVRRLRCMKAIKWLGMDTYRQTDGVS
jgi:hypothetical protein